MHTIIGDPDGHLTSIAQIESKSAEGFDLLGLIGADQIGQTINSNKIIRSSILGRSYEPGSTINRTILVIKGRVLRTNKLGVITEKEQFLLVNILSEGSWMYIFRLKRKYGVSLAHRLLFGELRFPKTNGLRSYRTYHVMIKGHLQFLRLPRYTEEQFLESEG